MATLMNKWMLQENYALLNEWISAAMNQWLNESINSIISAHSFFITITNTSLLHST